MPFRERVKRVFGRSPKDPNAPPKDKSKKNKKQDEKWEDWPENIYKPHEMPRPKYRRPADPAHKAALEGYSWDAATTPPDDGDPPRQMSHASMYSPTASKLPSRMGSLISRKGGKSRGPSRAGSVLAEGREGEGEESESSNVGLSRHHSQHSKQSHLRPDAASKSRPGTSHNNNPSISPLHEQSSAERTISATPRAPVDDYAPLDGSDGADLQQEATITEASETRRRERANTFKHDEPFTKDELERALTSLTLKPEPSAVAAAS